MNLTDDDDPLPAATLAARTATLQQQVAAAVRQPCTSCGAALCEHGALLTIVFGCRHAPRCPPCLASEQHEPVATMLERALQWIRRRECFLHVWQQADERESSRNASRCAYAATDTVTPHDPQPVAPSSNHAATPAADADFDAGDLGCGDLVLELRGRVRNLPPRGVLHVTARDPAAPIDLPAWCGLCGHTLLHASHPHYWIRRKGV